MQITLSTFLIIIVVCAILWVYSIYLSVIKKRSKAMEAFSSIDVQLKKRYDIILNILSVAQNFMEQEKTLVEEATKLRTKLVNLPSSLKNIDRKIALETELTKKMRQIIAAVENYPEIKANQTVVTAVQAYNELEEHISVARTFYNSIAKELRNAVEIFPSSFIARFVDVKTVDFFDIEEN